MVALFLFSCNKETVAPLDAGQHNVFEGYLTYTKTEKMENYDPSVQIETSWKAVEVSFNDPDSVFFKLPYLPRLGFACNEVHSYQLFHGSERRTEINLAGDTLFVFHLKKNGNQNAYLEEKWDFFGLKTK